MVKKVVLLWSAFFILGAYLLTKSAFESKSNDSRFYTDLIFQLKDQPVRQWIRPYWKGHYGNPQDKLIRDHFLGHIFLGLTLEKIGIPANHSLHILNIFFQILSLFFLFLMAREFFDLKRSFALLFFLQIIPINFSYGIRANHEQGLLLFTILAMYGALIMKRQVWGNALIFLGLNGVLFIKGIVVVIIPCLCLFILWYQNNPLRNYFNLIFMAVSLILSVLLYEYFYKEVSSVSFLEGYWQTQIQDRVINGEAKDFILWRKFKNLLYYFSRIFYYTLPFGFLIFIPKFYRKYEKGIGIFLVSALFIALLFSLSDRTSGRYIFQSYYLLATAFILSFQNQFPKFRKMCGLLFEKYFYAPPVLWFLQLNLHLGLSLFKS